MNLKDLPIILFDGACGTNIQRMDLPNEVWEDNDGCNEFLNLSAPEAIVKLHRSFYAAGSHVVETNTFGANEVVLAEYNLQDKVEEINFKAVEHAKKAAEGLENKFIAGSIGPGTKLPILGQIDYATLSASYKRQIVALVEAGVDCLILETCQDMLQVKIAMVTAREVFEEKGIELPICLSITIETTGTMLAGSDIGAVVATVLPFSPFSLGLNCATGPKDMQSHLRYLSKYWPNRISCVPNAGLPEIIDGQTVYKLTPEEYASTLSQYIDTLGVSVVGGCCGTTPEHIAKMAEAIQTATPKVRNVELKPQISSLYQAIDLEPEIKPLQIGERANTNGSRKFKELLLDDDYEGCLAVGVSQEQVGAPILDLCVAYAGRDEKEDMNTLISMFAKSVKSGVVLDSTTPECIEEGLKRYPGRLVVNSINLEDGGKYLEKVVHLIKKYGAAVIALAIHEKGQAMTTDEKFETCRRIHDLAVNKYGLNPSDLLFDPLTFPVGTGSDDLKDAGIQTIEAIRRIKKELPGVYTTLGLSNVSFGLSPVSRKILNSVFLHECVKAGLDSAIVDVSKIVPVAQISEEDKQACMDLIYNKVRGDGVGALTYFIEHFKDSTTANAEEDDSDKKTIEQQMADKLIKGDKEGLDDVLTMLMSRYKPVAIINQILIPAMKVVGDLFGKGEMLLPFVLQSAEVMKRSVAILEPFMDKKEDDSDTLKVLLATVQGDVHDIGKNLVDIILSNNGFKVVNIGIKQPAEAIIAAAKEHKVNVIGLSGLLVKSAIVMKESMAQYQEAGLDVPILLGGAALTPKFVAQDCVPSYKAPVVYCSDAFAGLKACSSHQEGKLTATTWKDRPSVARRSPLQTNQEVSRDNAVPKPPFIGYKHVVDIDPNEVYPLINDEALFRGRWGYRRAKMSADDYKKLIEDDVKPMYEDLKKRCVAEKLIQPKVAYGYFKAHSKENTVYVQSPDDGMMEFPFPRQALPPHFCISDYYHSEQEGGDVVGFFVVTIGENISRETKKLYEADRYHDYLMLHGFSVEVTDALAEYWHAQMRKELGFVSEEPNSVLEFVTQEYQGSRYGFGYPACPDMDAHINVFKLLKPEQIGVTLTESMEMVPEQSTSAIVAHHPQAKYFAV